MYSLALLIILMGYVSLKEVGLQETDTTGSGCSTSGDFSEYTLDELTAFFIIKQNKFTNFTNLFWHETVHPGHGKLLFNYAIPAHIDCVHSVNKHKYQPGIHV